MRARAILVRKLVSLFITLLAVWTFDFVLFHMLPGDPVYAIVGSRVPADMIEPLKERFGLNDPLYVQYFKSLGATVQGELGYSWFYKHDVLDVVLERLKYTMLLVGVGTFLTVAVGVFLGITAGSRRGEPLDVAIVGSSIAFYAMPAFWLAMILLMVLAGEFDLFPLRGFESISAGHETLIEALADRLWHMVLPITTFVLVSMSEFVLMMRNSLVDVLTEDYITTARAKGVSPRRIIRQHAVPNALIPTVATTAMFIGWVVTGAIMIEVVFSWPGVGSLTFKALEQRDFPVLQGIFLIVTLTMLIANFFADIVYTYIDPRVRI